MKNKKLSKTLSAFTLIEILLVLAIIGILASAVFAMIGNSDNSKRKAMLSTARSIIPYAQECYFKGNTLVDPASKTDGGDPICVDSETTWPAINEDACSYDLDSIPGAGYEYVIDCGTVGNISCNGEDGTCKEN